MGPLTTFNPKAAIPTPARRARGGSFNFQNAMSQDGINDNAATSAFVGQPINDFSISLWFRLPSVASNNSIFAFNPAASVNTIGLFSTSTFFFSNYFNNASQQRGGSYAPYNTGWNHVIIIGTQANTRIRTYLNGVLVENLFFTTGWFGNYGTLTLSQSAVGANRNNGLLDEFIFWKREITEEEVARYYNGGIGSDAYNIDQVGCWYRLNETGSPATAADSSGNGNDLTLTNGPTFVLH